MAVEAKSCDEVNNAHSNFETLRPSLWKSIEKIIAKENFTRHEVSVQHLQMSGSNFLGKLYEININGITPEGEREVCIFLKDKITSKNMNSLDVDRLYKNEALTYKEISKIMTKLQYEANVPAEDRFKIAKAFDETNNETIILENLCKRGFKIYSKSETPPLKFAELGIQELAKFHALSFVIEKKMPEFFKEKIVVQDYLINFDDDWKDMLRNVCEYIADLCDGETKMKFEKNIPIFVEKLPKYQTDRSNKCTLSHGDYRKSNIMVHTQNDEPMEVMIVDYQFIDYGNPMRDLLFFIFATTDKESRKQHLNYLKCLYFETMSRFLKYFDMDVEEVYPRREFEKIYKEWLDFGLMMTICASIVMFAPDTGVDFENMSLAQLPYQPAKQFDDILRGLVEDFVEWGYL